MVILQEGVIQLSDDLLINKGTLRICYEHPADKQFVIKVAIDNGKEGNLANFKEWKAAAALLKEHRELPFVSNYHGFVDTNQGKGLVCDCIRDYDDSISGTIWDYIIFKEKCDVVYIQQVMRAFCDVLILQNIRLFDLNLKNVALRLRQDGSFQPIAIDLKGHLDNHEFIPISNYISFFSRRKLQRRSTQLINRISDFRKRRMELQRAVE